MNKQKTKTGQYSTSEEILSSLAKDNEIATDILNWRSLKCAKYICNIAEINESTEGYIPFQSNCYFWHISSNRPNLQNIPIKTQKERK